MGLADPPGFAREIEVKEIVWNNVLRTPCPDHDTGSKTQSHYQNPFLVNI